MDWAVYLEHLQVVLREFDSVTALNKDTMIRYFRESLRPSIRAQLDVKNRELDSGMRLLIKPLMLMSKPASRLYLRPGRWILNALVVNDPLRKKTKILGILKRISFPRILLLMRLQAGPNPHRHSLRRNRTAALVEEGPNDRAKARIPLPLVSTPLQSGRTRTRIRIRKTSPTLSATLVSRKVTMPTNAPKRSQKTSVGLNNLHIGD